MTLNTEYFSKIYISPNGSKIGVTKNEKIGCRIWLSSSPMISVKYTRKDIAEIIIQLRRDSVNLVIAA